MIRVTDQLAIPEGEVHFSTSRSRGPGGQHVNKVETRVILAFDVQNSPSLSDLQKDLIQRRLGRVINGEGVLKVSSDRHRSQFANRKIVLERFVSLLEGALRIRRKRTKSSIPVSERQKRLQSKTRRGRIKQLRTSPVEKEE